MPAKYSHIKKRSASGLLKKNGQGSVPHKDVPAPNRVSMPFPSLNPHIDQSISQTMTAVSQLERAIARVLLLRFEQDIARLFSTRLYSIALVQLPTFILRCVALGGPGWVAHNADSEEVKDFFRSAISMDMRQAGERVATKSVLWSYTALRHFAMSNGVTICRKRGLHSLRLLPYFPALRAHLDTLESMPPPTFNKPPHLGTLTEGQHALEKACELKYASSCPNSLLRAALNCNSSVLPEWDTPDWREKIRIGYERLSQTLWRVAREFDVRGYGLILREKLTTKWCDCGCSTDHLGEVCERTVREEEELQKQGVGKDDKGKGKSGGVDKVKGKEKEWDGRGSGVYGWGTEEEEDIWEANLNFTGFEEDAFEDKSGEHALQHAKWSNDLQALIPEDELGMTVAEVMGWRYIKAEREKEEGNSAFHKGNYNLAVKHYRAAHDIEPELPHYQLNLAAAHLRLNNWIEAEKACTAALSQHKSSKGYYRRAKARRMMDRHDEAMKDLRAVLKLQPTNAEATAELISLVKISQSFSPCVPIASPSVSGTTSNLPSSSSITTEPPNPASGSPLASCSPDILEQLHLPKFKPLKALPFSKTKMDQRKLKIVIVPVPLDITPGGTKHPSDLGTGKGENTGDSRNSQKGSGVVTTCWERYYVKRID